MKKRLFLFYTLLVFTLPSCEEPADKCPENINSQPEYGHVQKCPEQIEADKKFIEKSEKQFSSLNLASRYYAQQGWSFLRQNDSATAMKRLTNHGFLIKLM